MAVTTQPKKKYKKAQPIAMSLFFVFLTVILPFTHGNDIYLSKAGSDDSQSCNISFPCYSWDHVINNTFDNTDTLHIENGTFEAYIPYSGGNGTFEILGNGIDQTILDNRVSSSTLLEFIIEVTQSYFVICHIILAPTNMSLPQLLGRRNICYNS